MSKTSPKPKQKVLFELEKADHHDFSAETIWTESLGNDIGCSIFRSMYMGPVLVTLFSPEIWMKSLDFR